MPCNVDITTQEVLKLAEMADPDGIRTMGVLTKPDLATEATTKDAIINLVSGKRGILNLVISNLFKRGPIQALHCAAKAWAQSWLLCPGWPPI